MKSWLYEVITGVCIQRSKSGYIISSGQRVDSYVNLYKAILNPTVSIELAHELRREILKLDKPVRFIAGRETAGILLAEQICSLKETKRNWDPVLVRDSKRDHGNRSDIEVATSVRGRCVLVDDVISTGQSMIDSIAKLESSGFHVVGIVCVVYRGLGAQEKAEMIERPFKFLIRYNEKVIEE
jgi:orotate phosphoribosyltransferase